MVKTEAPYPKLNTRTSFLEDSSSRHVPSDVESSASSTVSNNENPRVSSPTFPPALFVNPASPAVDTTTNSKRTVGFADRIVSYDSPSINPYGLLHFSQLPPWAQDNPHIHTHYRPVEHSVSACFHSYGYIHTKTFCTYTNTISACLYIIGQGFVHYYLHNAYPHITTRSHIIFAYYMDSATLYMILNALSHTLEIYSENARNAWSRLNFFGILQLILAFHVTAVFMMFYCNHRLQWIYWGIIIAISLLALINIPLPLSPPKSRSFRTVVLCLITALILIPLTHALARFGFTRTMQASGMPYSIGATALLLTGMTCFWKRWPERWLPGSFDLLGNSLQVFNVMALLAVVLHLVGLLQAFEWNYRHSTCG